MGSPGEHDLKINSLASFMLSPTTEPRRRPGHPESPLTSLCSVTAWSWAGASSLMTGTESAALVGTMSATMSRQDQCQLSPAHHWQSRQSRVSAC